MSWLKLDDQMHRHEKIAPLSDRAWRLHVTALLECCAKLTDGHIARDLPATWPAAPRGKTLSKTIAELEAKGLWEPNDNGWMAHDFLDWNPSAEKVLAIRKARAEAGRRGGQKPSKPEANAEQTQEQTGSKPEAKSNPVPVPVFLENLHFPPTPHVGDTSLAERARMATSESGCDRQTVVSQFGQPHTWPEVKTVIDHFQTVNGTPQNVVRSNEARVKAILMWFEAGRTIEDVSEVLTLAQKDDFWKARNIADVLKDLGRLDDFRSRKTTERRSGGKSGPRQPNAAKSVLQTPTYVGKNPQRAPEPDDAPEEANPF